MKRYALDASALMAFFERELGADRVERLLGAAAASHQPLLMSVVNWGEVYYSIWRKYGEEVARRTLAEIAQLPIELVDVDMELTKLAAGFKARHKLPFADAFAAALALTRKASLVTTDKDFAQVEREVSVVWPDRA